MKQFYFMSGLPRSGSTLLTSLLNQNPNIHSSVNSPVLDIIHYTEEYLKYSEQYNAFPNPEGAFKVLSSVSHNYYCNIPQDIIIDKSRGWANEMECIQNYITKTPKIICPVRSVLDILTSFISLIKKSSSTSFIDEYLIENNIEITDDNRCEYLMSNKGIVGQSLNALSEGFRKGYGKYILLVEYENLIQNPQQELNKIYDFLEIQRYNHYFENINQKEIENDLVYKLENMHLVRRNINKVYRNNQDYLSKYIITKYKHTEFWRKSSPNVLTFGLK